MLDDNSDPNALAPQRVVIELKNGEIREQMIDAPFGSPARPLTRSDQISKAHLCFEAAGFDADPRAVFAAIDNADETTRFSNILQLVTGQSGAPQ